MKKISNFISDNEKSEILRFVNSLNTKPHITNKHISEVASKLNGQSWMFDISKTEISTKLSKFQSSDNLVNIELPDIFQTLINRISKTLDISQDNVFCQILNQDSGGLIYPHYDSSIDGYITYKCNISVQSEKYTLYIGDNSLDVTQSDLYCFEASLYKHWTEEFKNQRVIVSYGFILPYSDLGRSDEDYRVRLSKRIVKYFQNNQ